MGCLYGKVEIICNILEWARASIVNMLPSLVAFIRFLLLS